MLTLSLLVVAWLPACVALVGSATVGARPRVLLLDVLDTLVVDPFFKGMHSDVFGFESMDEFFAAKDNQAYLDFETGAMTEAECFDRYFLDGRAVDVPALRAYLRRKYKFVPKIEPLLAELQALPAVELHVLSNYGPWWTLIEEELALSRSRCGRRFRSSSRSPAKGCATSRPPTKTSSSGEKGHSTPRCRSSRHAWRAACSPASRWSRSTRCRRRW